MSVTTETLALFVLLLPGFVSSAILNAIVVRKSQSALENIVEALVFSFLIYALLSPFFGGSPVKLHTEKIGEITVYRPDVDPVELLSAVGLSVILALLAGGSITNDLHMAVLRKLRFTARTARDNTWLDIFIDQKRYVIVTLTDGRRIFGWPQYFSNDPSEGLLYLFEPAWIDEEGNYIDLEVHGLLLVKKENIESIAFTHLTKETAEPRS